MSALDNIKLEYLADYPEFVEACAAWSYGRWGVQNKDASLDLSLERFGQGAQKEGIPLTILAINEDTGLPVAMGSIWESDSDRWNEVTPWIAAVFTHYRYRGQGIAKAIIARLEEEARRLGYKDIYLKSGSAAPMYLEMGYEALEIVETDETAAGTETLFKKELS